MRQLFIVFGTGATIFGLGVGMLTIPWHPKIGIGLMVVGVSYLLWEGLTCPAVLTVVPEPMLRFLVGIMISAFILLIAGPDIEKTLERSILIAAESKSGTEPRSVVPTPVLDHPVAPQESLHDKATKSGNRKVLIGSASIRYIKINTPRLIEGGQLLITVHAQIDGQVHSFLLSPNLAMLQFTQMPITEKDDIEADAAARRQQVSMRNALPSVSQRPPDTFTSNMDIFQTAVYSNIAKREVEGFITGQTRIYLLTFIAWRDGNNTSGYYEHCDWLQSMPSPEIGLGHAVWHVCR